MSNRAHTVDSMVDYAIVAVFVAALMFFGTGCNGVGMSANIYRIDEHQESHRTYRQSTPIKCWFVTCQPTADEAQGS